MKPGMLARLKPGFRGKWAPNSHRTRGPLVLILAAPTTQETEVVKAIGAIDSFLVADAKGTLKVRSDELDVLDPTAMLATIGQLTSVRLPVRVRAEPSKTGSGELEFEATCESSPPLRMSATGSSEMKAVEALRAMLVALIQPPESITLVL